MEAIFFLSLKLQVAARGLWALLHTLIPASLPVVVILLALVCVHRTVFSTWDRPWKPSSELRETPEPTCASILCLQIFRICIYLYLQLKTSFVVRL